MEAHYTFPGTAAFAAAGLCGNVQRIRDHEDGEYEAEGRQFDATHGGTPVWVKSLLQEY